MVVTPQSIRKAVIPAAGLGTRFLPATKAMPKEMLPVVDKPAIQYVVEECVEAGLEDVLVVTGRSKRALEDHFDRVPDTEFILAGKGDNSKLAQVRHATELARIHYVRQGDPKGLGHAVLCAKYHVGEEPFAVLLGDDLIDPDDEILKPMLAVQAKTGGSVIGLMRVDPQNISAYGVADVEAVPGEQYVRVKGLVEKPSSQDAPSGLAVIGRYVLHPDIFEVLENTRPGRGGEIQLTDALEILAKRESEGGQVYGVIFEGRRYDTGDKLSYIKAVVQIASKTEELGPDLRSWILRYAEELRK